MLESKELTKSSDDGVEQAKTFFEKNPNHVKQSKKVHSELSSSFFKATVNNQAVIFSKSSLLGQGATGKVYDISTDSINSESIVLKKQTSDSQLFEPESFEFYRSGFGYYTFRSKEKLILNENYILHKLGLYKGAFSREKANKYKIYTLQDKALGVTLKDFLTTHKESLTLAQKYLIAQRITEAVKGLHQQGVIHNDLKPGNIMIHPNGDDFVITIIDFGNAIKLKKGAEAVEDRGMPFTGTMGYYDPEFEHLNEGFIKKHPTYSKKSDIYALGSIFCSAIHPFLPQILSKNLELHTQDPFFCKLLNSEEDRPTLEDLLVHIQEKYHLLKAEIQPDEKAQILPLSPIKKNVASPVKREREVTLEGKENEDDGGKIKKLKN